MSDIVNKLITLSLNSSWKPIGYRTVKDAIISLTGSENKPEPSSLAIDIEYALMEDGTPDFANVLNMRPVTWSEWVTLPVREWDLSIRGANDKIYRVPTVIVSINYDKMPRKEFNNNPSNESIFKRDNYTCQITGQKLTREELNVDHVVPRSRGGSEGWENKITCRKDLNSRKGNKLNSEIGYKLIKQPVKPKAVDIMYLIREAKHPDWNHFLVKN